MSRDVLIINVVRSVEGIDHLVDGAVEPLGAVSKVFSVLKAALPDLDLSNPSWLSVHAPSYRVDFEIVGDEQVWTLVLHIHGSTEPTEMIERICNAGGWRAFDSVNGALLCFEQNRPSGQS